MPLFQPGDRICGRYVIDAIIGVGGMSEVYRGRDEQLHQRAVAIKALRVGSVNDPDTRLRVQDEARSLSALNHPHIAVLYDVCMHENAEVIVMEHLDGDTLAETLSDGPVPHETALRYALHIADALACAHDQGVVHGDVKPSNILVTTHGAKLLDFGLARLARTPAGATSGGTPFYMAPEQAAGSPPDARSDIYSFGLVLCQMLTGSAATPPPALPTRTFVAGLLEQIRSRPLRLVVERCVAPSPDQRWVHARDLHHALTVASESGPAPAVSAAPRPHKLASIGIGAAAGAAVLLAGWSMWGGVRPATEYQFTIAPPAGTHFVSLESGGPAAIAPDGRTIAFVAADSTGTTRIWTRQLGTLEATPLYGTERAAHPFWSPDSQSLGFFIPGRLQRISAAGGAVRTVAEAAQGRGGSWSADGVILFAPGFTTPISRVPAEGGSTEPVTALDFSQRETSHRWPVFLPDGRQFVFFVRSDRPDVRGLYLASLDSSERRRLEDVPSSAVYAAAAGGSNGHLLFARDGALTAHAFSPSDGRALGEAVPILQLPTPQEDTSVAPVSASMTGVLVHGGGSVFRQPLTWVERDGRTRPAGSAVGQYRNLRLSPDGRLLAIERLELRTGLSGVWLFDLARDLQQRFDVAPGAAFSPVWSPDGTSLVFSSYRGAAWDLVRRGITTQTEVTLLSTSMAIAATDWSSDGAWLLYQQRGTGARDQWDVIALEVATATPRALIRTEFDEHQAQLSPDSSWLAYTSNESGRNEVYVQRFPAMTPKFRVSTAGGAQPRWRADGRELLYVSPGDNLMAVTVEPRGEGLTLGASRPLVTLRMAPAAGFLSVANYDVDRSTGRILAAAPAEAEHLHQQLTVLVNWAAAAAR